MLLFNCVNICSNLFNKGREGVVRETGGSTHREGERLEELLVRFLGDRRFLGDDSCRIDGGGGGGGRVV